MPNLHDLLVPIELPHDDEVVTTERKDFSSEIRKELDRKLAESARNLIDPRGLL